MHIRYTLLFVFSFLLAQGQTKDEYVSGWFARSCLSREDAVLRQNATGGYELSNDICDSGKAILDMLKKSAKKNKENAVTSDKENEITSSDEALNVAKAIDLIEPVKGDDSKTILGKLKGWAPGLSLLGELHLANSLLNLTSDSEKIYARQSIIKAIYSSNELHEKCTEIRAGYAAGIEKATSLQSISNKEIAEVGFSETKLKYLGCGKGLFLPSMIGRILPASSFFWELSGMYMIASCTKANIDRMSNLSNKQSCSYAAFTGETVTIKESDYTRNRNKVSEARDVITISLILNLITIGAKSAQVYYSGSDLYTSITGESYKNISDICQCNHQLLRAAYKISELSKDYPEIMNIASLSNLERLEQKAQEDGEFGNFLRLLKTDYNTLWQHQSEALITMLHKYKDELSGIYEILGEFEAYLAMAEVKKRFDSHQRDISFSEISHDADSLELNMTQFWNPLVDADKAVPNSLNFASDKMRHMILTGSNAGGKSTLLKALLINVLFSQIYGIAFAQKMTLPVFKKILVTLNMSDDIAEENSLFMNEIKRSKDILENLEANQRSLVICDELFHGAAAANAGRAVAFMLKKISQHPQALSIFATHHGDAVTNLGDSFPFKNMKMDIKRDENGNIQYTFKCAEGISQENIADELLEKHLGMPKPE